jgi:hypothetical protein
METVEALNQRLIDEYGLDTSTGRQMYRISWANDQTEKRLTRELDSGIQLLFPEVREIKKYPYLKDLYVLESLSIVPDFQREELGGLKLSYEPIWAYRGPDGFPIAPIWVATKFIVDTLRAAMGKKSLRKYVDDEKNTTPEGLDQRITELAEELFGNETETGDAMAYGQAIVVPNNYEKKES